MVRKDNIKERLAGIFREIETRRMGGIEGYDQRTGVLLTVNASPLRILQLPKDTIKNSAGSRSEVSRSSSLSFRRHRNEEFYSTEENPTYEEESPG